MGLESTIICVDNSEYMRNGDYMPNRLQAQQDAVNTICRFKLRSNPENNVGLVTLSHNAEIVTTLTSDVSKILTNLHRVQPGGLMNLVTGLRIAHLALKHRSSRSHRMRVVVFVGSPLVNDEKEVIKVAKKLKKESVIVDVINFGETEVNTKLLEVLVNTVNGKDSSASHLVTIPAPCSHLADALVTSPVMTSEEGGANPAQFASGGAFEFGVDPNEDPELALALRVSMEEQRQRQQEEERRATGDSAADNTTAPDAPATPAPAPAAAADAPAAPAAAGSGETSEEAMLQQALAMSLESGAAPAAAAAPAPAAQAPAPMEDEPDFSNMTEEEQIAYAMQISMQDCESMDVDAKEGGAGADEKAPTKEKKEDLSAVMADATFLEGVLNKLPGVNPNSEEVKKAIDSYTGSSSGSKEDKKEDEEKNKKKSPEKKE